MFLKDHNQLGCNKIHYLQIKIKKTNIPLITKNAGLFVNHKYFSDAYVLDIQ